MWRGSPEPRVAWVERQVIIMLVSTISTLLAAIIVGLAVSKWHILKDRQLIVSAIRSALQERKPLWTGILAGIGYLAIFMILGGKGGRIHILFGRVIWNATPGEFAMGFALAVLLSVSVAVSIYGVQKMRLQQAAANRGVGLAGAFLALLACFCP
jgi:hypothetical protein